MKLGIVSLPNVQQVHHPVQRHHLHQERGMTSYPFCTIQAQQRHRGPCRTSVWTSWPVWQTSKKTPAIVGSWTSPVW